jgi:hypothetical protein
MKAALTALLWCATGASAAALPALDVVQRLADAAAPQLALNQVEQGQPRDPAAPGWAEWEAQRCRLLGQLERHQALMERVDALPRAAAATPQLAACFNAAADAAALIGNAEAVRRYAAALIWLLPPGAESQSLRLKIIDSYLMQRRGDEAFRSMLRFQQDYQPLARATANRFAEGLLALGMDKEGASWLAQLDDASAARQLLRLRSGLATPEAAITQARAALSRGGEAGHWHVIREAARRSRTSVLELEALEQLVQLADGRRVQETAAAARDLWQAYISGAQDEANRRQLLVGDDTTWADAAARRMGTEPQMARALFAHLAQRAQTPQMRRNAELQLAASLRSARLDRTALRLFDGYTPRNEELDAPTRHLLGAIAESRNQPDLALRYWDGLGPPPDTTVEQWSLRVARVAMRAGVTDRALATARQALSAGKALPAPLVQQTIALAQELLDAGKLDAANEIYDRVLPLTDTAQSRSVLFGLGRVHEATGQAPVAADFFLRSALLAEQRAPDPLALQARLLAALNLARAGYKHDARGQFEWLLRNSKDPAQLELAKRELQKL